MNEIHGEKTRMIDKNTLIEKAKLIKGTVSEMVETTVENRNSDKGGKVQVTELELPPESKSVVNPLDQLESELDAIDIDNSGKLSKFKNLVGKKSSPDEQKMELIRSFSVPDNRDDISDFLAMCRKYQQKTRVELQGKLSQKDRERKTMLMSIWDAKYEETFQKALRNYPNDEGFKAIQAARMKAAAAESGKKKKIIYIAGGFAALLATIIGIGSVKESHQRTVPADAPVAVVESADTDTEIDNNINTVSEEQEAVETETVESVEEETVLSETQIVRLKPAFSYSDVDEEAYDNGFYDVNDGVPFFELADFSNQYPIYGKLDSLGRVTGSWVMVEAELINEDDEDLESDIIPSGWNSISKDDKSRFVIAPLISGHLGGEADLENNISIVTKSFYDDVLCEEEEEVREYVESSGDAVLYRITPVFVDNNRILKGMLFEAASVKDHGDEFSLCRFFWNKDPEVTFNYNNGVAEESGSDEIDVNDTEENDIVKLAEVPIEDAIDKAITEAPVEEPAVEEPPVQAVVEEQQPAQVTARVSGGGRDISLAPGTLVWLSATGDCFHSINHCGRMNPDKAVQVTVEDAIAKGKDACEKCW